MSAEKVINGCSPESSLSSTNVAAEELRLIGSVDILSNHSSQEFVNTVEIMRNKGQTTPMENKVNTELNESRLIPNDTHNKPPMQNGSGTNYYLKDTLRSKSADFITEARTKNLLSQTSSLPVMTEHLLQPRVTSHSESDIEDISASELADRYADSLVVAPFQMAPKKTNRCILKHTASESKSGSSLQSNDIKEIYSIPMLNAASDELVEQLESTSSGTLNLQESHSPICGSLIDMSDTRSKFLQAGRHKLPVLNAVTSEELMEQLERISSGSIEVEESSFSPSESIQESGSNMSLSACPSHDSIDEEVELAQYTDPDPDSPIAGWKLDRRSSGQLFWRRDSSSLNGVDPRSRVKFRYDVEVCEFETRSSEAEDAPEDDDVGALDSEEEVYEKDCETDQVSVDRSEHSSPTTVIYSVAIIVIVMGVLYGWLISTFDDQ